MSMVVPILPLTHEDVAAARRLVRYFTRHDIDDLVQEVLIAFCCVPALVVYDGWTPVQARRGVLGTIALRKVAQRAEAADKELSALAAVEPIVWPRVEDEGALRAALVARALEEELLPRYPDEHTVVVAMLAEDVPAPVIAREVGVPVSTAYARLRNGKEHLRATLHRWEAEERAGATRARLRRTTGGRE